MNALAGGGAPRMLLLMALRRVPQSDEIEFAPLSARQRGGFLSQGGGGYRRGTHNPLELGSSPSPATTQISAFMSPAQESRCR